MCGLVGGFTCVWVSGLAGKKREKDCGRWFEGVVGNTALARSTMVRVVVGVDGEELLVEGEVIFAEGGNLRPIPKWFTLFFYVVGKRRVLTKAELAEELAGEP